MHDFRGPFLGAVPIRYDGAAPSRGLRWWVHHIGSTRAYLEASFARDQDRQVAAILELWNGILEWQGIAGKPAAVLMAEHTALAKLLVDCVSSGQDHACADVASAALGRNVEAQGLLFPKDPKGFAGLFGRHVEITGAYVAAYAAGNFEEFKARYEEALENGRELGVFTDRNFA